MKREKSVLIIATISLIFFSLLSNISSSQEVLSTNLENNIDNLDKLRDKVENPGQIREEYLAQEWSKLISENPTFGPINSYFESKSKVFQIIFGEPYSISLKFIVTILFWIYFATLIFLFLSSLKFINKISAIVLGIASTIILAQIRLIALIQETFLSIFFSKEDWWIRIIIVIVLVFLLVLGKQGVSQLSKIIKSGNKKQEEEKEKTNREILERTTKEITNKK